MDLLEWRGRPITVLLNFAADRLHAALGFGGVRGSDVALACCDVVEAHLRGDREELDAAVPALMLLANWVRADTGVKEVVAGRVIPAADLEEVDDIMSGPRRRGNVAPADLTFREVLIDNMTSVSDQLNHHANDFLYALTGDDVDLFVRNTGFGNAAGMLFSRGLLSQNMMAGYQAKSSAQRAKKRAANPEPERKMTEEEAEEIERLMTRFDQLQSGVPLKDIEGVGEDSDEEAEQAGKGKDAAEPSE